MKAKTRLGFGLWAKPLFKYIVLACKSELTTLRVMRS